MKRRVQVFFRQLNQLDYVAIITTLAGVNMVDIISFLGMGRPISLGWKIVVSISFMLSLLVFVGARLDFKEMYVFREQSKNEAEFFGKWYSRKGKHFVFCTDLDWLEDEKYECVVRALKSKAEERRLNLYLKDYGNAIVNDLVTRGAELYRVRPEIVSEHRFSINTDEHVYSIIIRNKKTEREKITVEEYIDHRAFANLGLDMLSDCYISP